jgi:glucuronoarabinoxylan endo-1,4-beta-xylanase
VGRRRIISAAIFLAVWLYGSTVAAQTITVNWSDQEQIIDGFGGSVVGEPGVAPMTSAQAALWFSASSGLGLSIVRLSIQPDFASCAAWAGSSNCATVSSGATVIAGEAKLAQLAQMNGVATFFASSWSPPAAMKRNKLYRSGGDFIGNKANYALYASELASFAPLMFTRYGIPIYAISPQNEPEISQDYPTAVWTEAEFDAFFPYLHSAVAASGYGPLLMMPENAEWSATYDGLASTTMDDSAAGPYVGILAQHGYAGDNAIIKPETYTYKPSHLWLTEDASQSHTYDGTMQDALGWARIIHNYLTVANVNAFVFWQIDGEGTNPGNTALTDASGNPALRAYVLGNWSKFVRPGWKRVGTTDSPGNLLVTAFMGPNGEAAIVVANESGSAVENQSFNVGTTMGTGVVPWITSSTQSLKSQPPVSVSSGAFVFTIPGDSVVTFSSSPADR